MSRCVGNVVLSCRQSGSLAGGAGVECLGARTRSSLCVEFRSAVLRSRAFCRREGRERLLFIVYRRYETKLRNKENDEVDTMYQIRDVKVFNKTG